jgi:hypothetical protein
MDDGGALLGVEPLQQALRITPGPGRRRRRGDLVVVRECHSLQSREGVRRSRTLVRAVEKAGD